MLTVKCREIQVRQSMPGSTAWLHSFSIQYEKVVSPSQAEYSYFSAGFRLKIILCYFKKERISHDTLCGFVRIFCGEFTVQMYYMYRSSNCH